MTKTRSRKSRNHSKNQDLSAFDFGPEDERIERRSKKLLRPFKTQKPIKFGSPVDKYSFLRSFTGERSILQNDRGNEILHVDDSDDSAEKKIPESRDTVVASRSSNVKPSTNYWLCHLESNCDTSGAKSHSSRLKTPGCSVTDGKTFSGRSFANNEPVILDLDDANEIKSSKPACYLPENKGNQQELMQSSNLCDTRSHMC